MFKLSRHLYTGTASTVLFFLWLFTYVFFDLMISVGIYNGMKDKVDEETADGNSRQNLSYSIRHTHER